MDVQHFDDLTRSLSVVSSRRRILAIAATLIGAGQGEKASGTQATHRHPVKGRKHGRRRGQGRNKGKGKDQPQGTLTFCQDEHTIIAPANQQAALLASGATLGACTDPGETCLESGEECATTTECCGILVCARIEDGVGVCRPNHVPVALKESIVNQRNSSCVPVSIWGYEPDFDFGRFRIVSLPTKGFLTGYVNRDGGAARIVSRGMGPTESGPGWTTGLPAPALPDDLPRNCVPRQCNLFDNCEIPASTSLCPDCTLGANYGDRSPWYADENGDLAPTADVTRTCPEGWYLQASVCYVQFDPTATGIDKFMFSLVDEHGAEGPPVTFTIEIFEP